MAIWLAMAVPIVTAGLLYFWFHHKTLWWEFIIPFGISAILIFVCKFGTQKSLTHDTEYWGGWMTKAEHYEDWDEQVPCCHPKFTTTIDSKGNSHTVFAGFQHSYDVDYHPPYWQVSDSNGIAKRIDEQTFNKLVTRFGNHERIVLNRDYHSNDGDKYVTTWPGDDQTLVPITTLHSYENRVQATHTIIEFNQVDPKRYNLFEYPEIRGYYQCPAILGDGGPTKAKAERITSRTNAKLGKRKQIRIWILIFKDKPLDAAFDQRDYWKGGNKNELIVCIGVNKAHQVQWCYPISWTEVESLKVDARNFVIGQKGKPLDLVAIANWLHKACAERFVRKQFADFDYLTIDPPAWGYVLTFVLTIAINGGLSWYIVANEFRESVSLNDPT
ncbi:MAG TPA: hypothetical protein VJC05_03075 [Candidatus Andersenbacteria bacterium]|nr:MAG: hypothetical protein A2854_01980 [Parcubacteria group bacterium RIFCSPHIGHO2_01_FULL_56_18]HLD25997.1 hypothetical protein [Candidatus Andersenbacteria bacterium]